MNFIFPDWEYFGIGTDLDAVGTPISELDRLAMIHDYSYARANRIGGHSGRSAKAQADFAMAGATSNFIVKSGLYVQGMIRVFTFNELNLPW